MRAASGAKMSKSLGNAIDPLEVIGEMGTDALRFSMLMLSAQDVYLSREKFEVGRNFVNKLWNASRFVMMNLEGFKGGRFDGTLPEQSLALADLWILSRLSEAIGRVDGELGEFGMAQASTGLYHFVWNDFCDWYIELVKPVLTTGGAGSDTVRKVLFHGLDRILRLLHPFIPFVTEEIWQKLAAYAEDAPSAETLMLAPWPQVSAHLRAGSEEACGAVSLLEQAVSGLRDLRVALNIPPSQQLATVVTAPDEKVLQMFLQFESQIKKLGRLESFTPQRNFQKDRSVMGREFADFEIFIRIEGLVDLAKEQSRIVKKIEEVRRYAQSISGKLANANFVRNAPPEVVEEEREKLEDAQKVLKAQEETLALLSR